MAKQRRSFSVEQKPHISFDKEFIEILVANLETTISLYLFFWQVTMGAEDVKSSRQLILVRRKLLENTEAAVVLHISNSRKIMKDISMAAYLIFLKLSNFNC